MQRVRTWLVCCRIVLLAACVGLLTLAYAPFKQFYCAWLGLAPWLVLVGRWQGPRPSRSLRHTRLHLRLPTKQSSAKYGSSPGV